MIFDAKYLELEWSISALCLVLCGSSTELGRCDERESQRLKSLNIYCQLDRERKLFLGTFVNFSQ